MVNVLYNSCYVVAIYSCIIGSFAIAELHWQNNIIVNISSPSYCYNIFRDIVNLTNQIIAISFNFVKKPGNIEMLSFCVGVLRQY